MARSFSPSALALIDAMSAAAADAPAEAISFQGAPGANSHLALIAVDRDAPPLPCYSFDDALEAVSTGTAGRAIIPIENSLHGRVADIHRLLPDSGLMIVGEYFLSIRHALMSRDLARPERVMSHEQALGQCRDWLRANGMAPVQYADTAGAAAFVADSDEPGLAAIAPAWAAELYGLTVHVDGIEDSGDNMTRFVILAREEVMPARDVATMTSLIFDVPNRHGALYKALGGFATNGVNMTRLESYQPDAGFAATRFFADITGAPGEAGVDEALAELRFHADAVRLLGSYPMARARG